jgi:hypothetical protein
VKIVNVRNPVLLLANFLFFGKDYLQVSAIVSPPRLRLRVHQPPGSALLHQGLLMVALSEAQVVDGSPPQRLGGQSGRWLP